MKRLISFLLRLNLKLLLRSRSIKNMIKEGNLIPEIVEEIRKQNEMIEEKNNLLKNLIWLKQEEIRKKEMIIEMKKRLDNVSKAVEIEIKKLKKEVDKLQKEEKGETQTFFFSES